MPEYPSRREEDERWEGPILELARSVGALVNFVTDVAAQLVAAGHAPAAPPLETYHPATPGFRPYGSEQRLASAAREPLVDVFDEDEEIVLVVEWPDGDVEQIEVSVQDDVLALVFGPGTSAVDLLLPGAVEPSSLRRRARNGIVEIRMRRM
jgi:hypothetical protein